MAQNVSSTTADHDTIRRWAEERAGWPAQVVSTVQGQKAGAIRIDFPGYTGEEKLERIPWEEWFRKFDESKLAFAYEETTAGGQRSSFNELVSRERAKAPRESVRTEKRTGKGAARAEGARKLAGAEAPVARETGKRPGRKTRARTTGEAKRGYPAQRGKGRRQTSQAAAARTAGRAAPAGRKPPAKARTSRTTSRGKRRGTGRTSR